MTEPQIENLIAEYLRKNLRTETQLYESEDMSGEFFYAETIVYLGDEQIHKNESWKIYINHD